MRSFSTAASLGALILALAARSPAVAQAPPTGAAPATSAEPATGAAPSTVDVNQLFATTCGWCHSDGGRTAGRGPQLMDTTRTDSFIRYRIKHGKEGSMPAFANLSDADLDAIIVYIRGLKPESK